MDSDRRCRRTIRDQIPAAGSPTQRGRGPSTAFGPMPSGLLRRTRLVRAMKAVRHDETGATLVLVAMSMVAMLGFAALAVDYGMLTAARTDAQRVADAAAHAGAVELWFDSDDAPGAEGIAIQYAAQNEFMNVPGDVRPEDVFVDLANDTIRVIVRRDHERGNAVPTFFARVLGIDAVDISAAATAEVANGGAAECLFPAAIPDGWLDVNGNGLWDPGVDVYRPAVDPETGEPAAEGTYTGYTEDDIGDRIELFSGAGSSGGGKGSGNGGGRGKGSGSSGDGDAGEGGSGAGTKECTGDEAASWRCWFHPEPENGKGGGVPLLEEYILGCPSGTGVTSYLDDKIHTFSASGQKQSLIKAVRTLIAQDPTAEWKNGGVVGSAFEESPRVRVLPVVYPDQVEGQGANTTVPIANFVGVFIEKVATGPDEPHDPSGQTGQMSIYVRLMQATGLSGSAEPSESLVKTIRLIS